MKNSTNNNNTRTTFALDPSNSNNNNANQINYNNNNNLINNNNNNNVVNESDNNYFDNMLHSNDDNNNINFQDSNNNHGENMFNNDLVDDYLVDPLYLLCDEIMEDPLMDQIFTGLTSAVPVNCVDNDNNNNQSNNAVILLNNNGDDNQQNEEVEENGGVQQGQEVLDNSLSFDHSCSSCPVLREITHINGTHTIKLELHGVIGVISHAILINHFNPNNNATTAIQENQMIDFSGMSYNTVKEYIEYHLEEQRQKGYTMLQEEISPFYEALCVGYNWLLGVCPNSDCSNHFQSSPLEPPIVQEDYEVTTSNTVAGESQMMGHQQVVHQPEMNEPPIGYYEQDPNTSATRTELSIQRERTKNMRIEDFSQYFDQPVKIAAQKLYLCDTVVKKKLRSFGIPRWPFRKVNSMKRRISELMVDLRSDNAELRAYALSEIHRIQHQINEILRGNIHVIRDILSQS